MASEIRRCTKDDKEALLEIISYAYSMPERSHERILEKLELRAEEFFMHTLNGEPTAAARCIPLHQNIRGAMKKMAGIGLVASNPEFRRRGYTRDLMIDILTQVKKDGYSLSTLYPFKDSFYSALGYVKMPPLSILEIDPHNLCNVKKPDSHTAVRETGEEAIKVWRDLHEYTINRSHGAVLRSDDRWNELKEDLRSKIAVARNSEGNPEGVLVYTIKGYGEGHSWAETGEISLNNIFWKTLDARDALFHFLYTHLDQVKKVRMVISPTLSDYYHYLSEFHTPKIEAHIISMARIVEVETSFNGFPTIMEDDLVVKVTDRQLMTNEAVYRFAPNNGVLEVSKINTEPEVIITIEGLTAFLYGVLDVPNLQHLGWLHGELPQTLIDSFPSENPWLTEDF